ncbi:MAG TPA: zinc-binding dehydrogenase [Candidatus Saccharimonadales bacterium]|nr:zinc-binding dehydrogenase [Candidatus Saccharimonadales bacterium]
MSASDTIPATITHLVIDSIGTMALYEEPTRPLEAGEFFIKTLFSGISAGTELTFFMGTNPKASEGFDPQRRVFRGDLEPDAIDIFPKYEGYMEVGEVVASRNDKYPVGTKVAGLYHHRSGHIANDSDNLIALPEGFDPILGIWVSKMGPISMNGVLYAADEVNRKPVSTLEGSLQGQRVVVFGAGMIGLLCGVFAKWAGAEDVVIVDGIEERLAIAAKLGLTPHTAKPGMSIELKDRWMRDDARDTGADIAFQCTGSDYLLAEAFRTLREQGTVIDLGFYQQGANQVFLGKEFHHNCLRHVCAQIGTMPRAQQAEWNRRRLSEETISFLQQHGATLKEHLITHIVPFVDAQEAFERLAARDNTMLQVVLDPWAKGGN